jgi:hypothetical protein
METCDLAICDDMGAKDGLLIMHEVTRPTHPFFLALWNAHFKFLRAYASWRHPEWNFAFNDVPSFLGRTRWVDG